MDLIIFHELTHKGIRGLFVTGCRTGVKVVAVTPDIVSVLYLYLWGVAASHAYNRVPGL